MQNVTQQDNTAVAGSRRRRRIFTAGLLTPAAILAVTAGFLIPAGGRMIDLYSVVIFSLTAAVVVVAPAAKQPQEVKTFPALFVITLLGGLSLSAAVTRTILLRSDPGVIIRAVGGLISPAGPFLAAAGLLVADGVICGLTCKTALANRKVAARCTYEATPTLTQDLGVGDSTKSVTSELRFFSAMSAAAGLLLFAAVVNFLAAIMTAIAGLGAAWTSTPHTSSTGLAPTTVLTALVQGPVLLLGLASNKLLRRLSSRLSGKLSHSQVAPERASEQSFADLLQSRLSSEPPQADEEKLSETPDGGYSERLAEFESPTESAGGEGEAGGREQLYEDILRQIEGLAEQGRRIFLFAGSRPAEPRLTTVVNIAIRLAQSGRKSLLVDTDSARDAAAKVFELSPDDTGGGPCETGIENLCIWPAHNFSTHTTESLPNRFSELSSRFNHVLIYAPNLCDGPLTESLGKSLDAVLFFQTAKPDAAAHAQPLPEKLRCSGCVTLTFEVK